MQMSVEQVRQRFGHARIARLATADSAGTPHIVPVTFALHGDVLCFAVDHKAKTTTRLRRLRNIERNPAVSILVDHYDEDWSALWWARADGTAHILHAEHVDQRADLIRALSQKYRQYAEWPPTGAVVRIDVTRWTGWSATEHALSG